MFQENLIESNQIKIYSGNILKLRNKFHSKKNNKAPKKYLRQTKVVPNLYFENYKTLSKETKDDFNGKTSHVHGLESSQN